MASATTRTEARWLARNKRGWSPRLYEGWFTHNLFQAAIRAKEQEAFYGALLRAARAEHDVLELGPGTGHYTLPLAAACRSVTALDSSPAMLEHLMERVRAEGLDNVRPLLGCATAVPALDGAFDGLLAAGLLNYVPDVAAVLGALAERLRPGGWAVFSVPLASLGGRVYRASERLSGHRIWVYEPERIARIAQGAGLTVCRMTRAGVSRAGMTLVVEARR